MLSTIKIKNTGGVRCFDSRNYLDNTVYENNEKTISNLLLTRKSLKDDNIKTAVVPAILTEIYDNNEINKLSRYFNE